MAAESAGDDGFDDYTLATPWERLVASLEEALSGWQAAGPAALAAQCEPASAADALRCVTVTLPVPRAEGLRAKRMPALTVVPPL